MSLQALAKMSEQMKELLAGFEAGTCDGELAKRFVEAFALIERLSVAGKTLALAQVDRTRGWSHGSNARSSADWLAQTTGSSMGEAIRVTQTARNIEGLGFVEEALRQGRLSGEQASVITDAASVVPHLENALLKSCENDSLVGLRKRVAQIKSSADESRSKAQHSSRRARRWSDSQGMRRYEIALAPRQALDFEPLWDRLCTSVINRCHRQGIAITAEAALADALVDMAQCARNGHLDGDSKPTKAHGLVLVDAKALHRGKSEADETCEIAGIGPIDVASAKEILGDGVIDILVTDGVDVKTVAHVSRRANRTQRAALLANWECEIKGCSMTSGLEIDHIVAYSQSGVTDYEDLGMKCRYHHSLKTYKGFRDGPKDTNGKRVLISPEEADGG